MSKADYNKAVSRGDIGQNFSAKPNFFEKIQDKAQTLSLKNLYDTKTGAKKMSPFAFANYVNSFNPAFSASVFTASKSLTPLLLSLCFNQTSNLALLSLGNWPS